MFTTRNHSRGRKRKFDIEPDSIMDWEENQRRTTHFIKKHIYIENQAVFLLSGEKTTMISNEDFRSVKLKRLKHHYRDEEMVGNRKNGKVLTGQIIVVTSKPLSCKVYENGQISNYVDQHLQIAGAIFDDVFYPHQLHGFLDKGYFNVDYENR